jgi:hypothetical protein
MLQGCTVPLSPQGDAKLASAPPCHHVGDVLAMEFSTDPAAAEATLPDGPSPFPDSSGHGVILFVGRQFFEDNKEYLERRGAPDQGRGARQRFASPHGRRVIRSEAAGSGESDLFPARGEELADPAPLRTGRGFRASMCYTVTEVRDRPRTFVFGATRSRLVR